jgi:hypothetical protein
MFSRTAVFTWLAIITAVICAVPYFVAMWQRKVKPHGFSWLVWAITLGVAAGAQSTEAAGPVAWATAIGSINCALIAFFSIFIGEKRVTRGDMATLAIALMAIPIWVMTHTPLWSVLLVAGIDTVAFYPTFRKSWIDPAHENISAFILGIASSIFTIAGLENFSLVNWIYSAVIAIGNALLVAIVLHRRRQMPSALNHRA